MHDELAIFKTPHGWCAMLGRGEVLRALTFGHRNAESAIDWLNVDGAFNVRRSSWNRPLAERIAAVLAGEPDDLRDVEVDVEHLTPFARKVAAACRRIPWGQTPQLCPVGGGGGPPERGAGCWPRDGEKSHSAGGAVPSGDCQRRALGRLLGTAGIGDKTPLASDGIGRETQTGIASADLDLDSNNVSKSALPSGGKAPLLRAGPFQHPTHACTHLSRHARRFPATAARCLEFGASLGWRGWSCAFLRGATWRRPCPMPCSRFARGTRSGISGTRSWRGTRGSSVGSFRRTFLIDCCRSRTSQPSMGLPRSEIVVT